MAPNPDNRNLLDQLTAAATAPPTPVPSVLGANDPAASASSNLPPVFPAQAQQSTTPAADSDTEDLESRANSPESLATKVAATKATEQEEHPGFLDRLKSMARGEVDPRTGQTVGGIGNILSSIGTAGSLAFGSPEQKQIAIEQEKIPLQMSQIQNEMAYRNGMLGIRNQANENTAAKTGLQYGTGENGQPLGTSRETAAANLQRATVAQKMADENIKRIEASLQGTNYVDPNLAHALGRDDLAGKNISPLAYQQQITNVSRSRGFHTIDTGKDDTGDGQGGQWVVDNTGHKIYQISPYSPVVARGQAYGAARPQAVIDAQGNARIMSAGQAEAEGVAPAQLGAQIMSKNAQFRDIYNGISTMRNAVNGLAQQPFDAKTIGILTLASRDPNPAILENEINTIAGTQQLTEPQQDFLVAMRQLNERAMSIRNLAGMGNASDQLRAAITATLPTVSSGSAAMMRKQLNQFQNFVDNLSSGIPNVKGVERSTPPLPGSKNNNTAPAATPQFSKYSSDGKWGWNGTAWVSTGSK